MVVDALLFLPRVPLRLLGETGALVRATPRLPRIERALTARVESADDRIARLGTAARALRRELTMLRKQIEPLDSRIVSVERSARPLGDRLAAMETTAEPVHGRLAGVEAAIKRLADTLREMQRAVEPLNDRLTGLEQTAADLQEGLVRARERFERANAGPDGPARGAPAAPQPDGQSLVGGRFARP